MRKLLVALIALAFNVGLGQDSVDVIFRYTPPSGVGTPYVPGEFNDWTQTAWPMTYIGGPWIRTARLRIGGNPNPPLNGVPGAWQYKFWYQGVEPWPNDPLNHHVNPRDHDNSFIIVKDPTIYHFVPNQRLPLVTTGTPTISAYLFPKVGTVVDTSTISLTIDGTTYTGIGANYDFTTKQLTFTVPTPLPNGSHTVILRAGSNADTVTFVTQAGFVQITTQGGYVTRDSIRQLRGVVQDTSVTTVRIVQNDADTLIVSVSNGRYSESVRLVEGLNVFRAIADSSGVAVMSDPVTFTYLVNHSPTGRISFVDGGSTIQLQATGSTDPDSGQTATLTFLWSEDPANPTPVGGVNGASSPTINVNRPSVPGEYYFGLIATDVDGNRDTTRNYFTIGRDGSVTFPTLASVPSWVQQGRMYELFFKSHTPAGTINAAIPDLDRIAAMGYNIIWVMPVMKNRDPINNGPGPGYNIVDFYTVAPEYGTNEDFKNFVRRAHQLGMKVILDVTPNHTSSSHPFVLDATVFREDSRYWNYYQHQIIPYTGGVGLGQFGDPPNHQQVVTPSGFVYYGPFSDALVNYNWSDIDARHYMLEVYKWWVKEMGVDGFRFDVYWGPHIRANSPQGGEGDMGRPMRALLKHFRPDIHLLAEATGVGTGTERIYADNSGAGGPGGVESAYDWSLYWGFIADTMVWRYLPDRRVNDLDRRLRNFSSNDGMGFLPGPNSYFLRFMENHDEDRVIHVYRIGGVDSITAMRRTMSVSTAIMLAVGTPLVYAGQEVGMGWGLPGYDMRRRGVIRWDSFATSTLMPHYQKLAQIRKQFVPFTTQKMVRAASSVPGVYAYTRPYSGLNGVVVVNLDGVPHTATVTLSASRTPPSVEGVVDGFPYVATDLYNGTSSDTVRFAGGTATLTVNLPALGSAVFVLDDSARTLILPRLTGIDEPTSATLPAEFRLYQNYPNPFNPSTTIRYELPRPSRVSLKVFDILGREVATLVNLDQPAGRYEVQWDASGVASGVSSGVYFYRLSTDHSTLVRKMLLLR